MADRIDQLKIGSTNYDIALPSDSKDTMFYTTASATANAFTVTVPDLQALYDGAVVNVKFNAATAALKADRKSSVFLIRIVQMSLI